MREAGRFGLTLLLCLGYHSTQASALKCSDLSRIGAPREFLEAVEGGDRERNPHDPEIQRYSAAVRPAALEVNR